MSSPSSGPHGARLPACYHAVGSLLPSPPMLRIQSKRTRGGSTMAAHLRSRLALSLVAGATVLAVAAPPAPAHTISLRAASKAVKSEAAKVGQVDRARCWRPVVGT